MAKDKTNKNWFSRHKVLTVILAVILLIIFVNAIDGGDKDATTTKSPDESKNNKTEEKKTEFKTGETVVFDKRELTVDEVVRNYETGNEFAKPEAGNEFVIATVTLKNNSDTNMSFNTFDFKLQDSNGVQKGEDFMAISEGKLSTGDLAPGGKVSGKLGFQVPAGDTGLKLIYNGSLFGKTITINL